MKLNLEMSLCLCCVFVFVLVSVFVFVFYFVTKCLNEGRNIWNSIRRERGGTVAAAPADAIFLGNLQLFRIGGHEFICVSKMHFSHSTHS